MTIYVNMFLTEIICLFAGKLFDPCTLLVVFGHIKTFFLIIRNFQMSDVRIIYRAKG